MVSHPLERQKDIVGICEIIMLPEHIDVIKLRSPQRVYRKLARMVILVAE